MEFVNFVANRNNKFCIYLEIFSARASIQYEIGPLRRSRLRVSRSHSRLKKAASFQASRVVSLTKKHLAE